MKYQLLYNNKKCDTIIVIKQLRGVDKLMFWDWTYIFVIIGALICAAASLNVNSAYKKFSVFENRKGLTAQEVAEFILHHAGIFDIRIERVKGSLTDHYSPKEKVLRLSESVYGSKSVAAIGVAAHECGHAIQHNVGYFPLKLRSISVPMANIGSAIYWPVIIIGLILGYLEIAQIGILLFSFVIIFQLITLPVEFNASHRALSILSERNILVDDELQAAGKVLKAAALTYVAALFSSILQLLRLIALTNRNNRQR